MKTYIVEVGYEGFTSEEVMANNRDEAIKKAKEIANNVAQDSNITITDIFINGVEED